MQPEQKDNKALFLLKKGQTGLMKALFSRLGVIVALLAIQVLILFSIFQWFEGFLPHILGGTMLFTAGMVLYLLNSSIDPTAKNTWLVVIMLLPVFGALLFWYTQSDIGHRALKDRINQIILKTKKNIPQSEETIKELSEQTPRVAALVKYIQSSGNYPIYQNTDVTYFPSGEEKWEEMLIQLEQAKHFIFMEYFIIEEGIMWGRILEILARKAKEGVDVRVMYDGTCEFSTLSHDYPKRLQTLGIKCKVFAPVSPFVSTHYNYRDHRKILVIDGHTAFNGGVNLADEYINHIEKHGHWKDVAVMLKGEAVKSFTLMFLQMWNIDEKNMNFEQYLVYPTYPPEQSEGFVMPYGDCPLDNYQVGERVYTDILNRAEKYVHIMSPYLILDGDMETALQFAAERGVDVKLILPGIPDQAMPYALAKTHYASLIKAGVKIYQYTPGFVHAKVFVSDNQEAVVGTINLDYRSLYHHFECATYMYQTSCISEIEQDYQNTLQKCKQITLQDVKEEKWAWKLTGFVLKVLAPLM